MHEIDLQSFVDWLHGRSLADEKHAPHYARWVKRFLQSAGATEGAVDKDRIMAFSDALERDPALEDWQRRQAVRATELYLNGFLKEGPAATIGASSPEPVGGARDAVGKARELLRLRHYSYQRFSRAEIVFIAAERMRVFAASVMRPPESNGKNGRGGMAPSARRTWRSPSTCPSAGKL